MARRGGEGGSFSGLNDAQQAIIQAVENDYDELAPKSLRTASLDYQVAINMIAQSPRSPDIYEKNVDDAKASATQLFDFMNVITGSKGTQNILRYRLLDKNGRWAS